MANSIAIVYLFPTKTEIWIEDSLIIQKGVP